MKPKNTFLWIGIASSSIGYFLLAYILNRADTLPIQLCFCTLFLFYFSFVFFLKRPSPTADSLLDSPRFILVLGILFRAIFLFSYPVLSDDFYRFIWDGVLWNNGIHPFSHVPSFYMQTSNAIPHLSLDIYQKLNSPNYFTVYPPMHQVIFWLSTLFFHGNVLYPLLIMRSILLAVDIYFLFLLTRILVFYKKDKKNILLYALNPLVIIESIGNLHFESMVVCLVLLSFFYLDRKKIRYSAFFWTLSIATKLVPLLFAPLILSKLSLKKNIPFFLFSAICLSLFFIPLFYKGGIYGQWESISLYIQKFEFNASIYYLIRAIGYALYGYNIIQTVGIRLLLASFACILVLCYFAHRKKYNYYDAATFILLLYYLFSTTVHPWYIILLVGFSCLGNFIFPLLWSYTITWTYIGYTSIDYNPPYIWIILEYLIIICVCSMEVFMYKKTTIMQERNT
ncbi:MAG: hypothetical protein QM536_01320 [Chitinophagaceae bacterium]|nr:hypothetical protein [Chitinophagaceae bacterium]